MPALPVAAFAEPTRCCDRSDLQQISAFADDYSTSGVRTSPLRCHVPGVTAPTCIRESACLAPRPHIRNGTDAIRPTSRSRLANGVFTMRPIWLVESESVA